MHPCLWNQIRWKMLNTLLLVLVIVGISVLLLGVRVFFVKGGRFPNTHVSGNKALRQKGIGCVQSQDREAQRKPLSPFSGKPLAFFPPARYDIDS